MLKVIKPQYYIKIGIKDGMVCSIDLKRMKEHEKIKNNKQLYKKLLSYLKSAVKFIEASIQRKKHE